MTNVPVVENPRRSRRRRRYSPAQKRAGFGGRASMSRGRSTRRRRRRANPALATISNTRRRRGPRKRRDSYTTYRTYRRHYARRRRNPSLRGLTQMLHLPTAASVAGGIFVARLAPELVRKVWAGAPAVGVGGMAVKVGGVLVAAMVAKTVFRSDRIATGLVAGGIGYILFDLAEQYLLPQIGLSGLGNDRYLTTGELEAMGLSGYQSANRRVPGYQPGNGETVDSVLAV